MSDTPAVYGQFGQALGLAERTLSAILREQLAQRNTVPEAWYTLRLLATRGPAYPRADLTRLLEGPASTPTLPTACSPGSRRMASSAATQNSV